MRQYQILGYTPSHIIVSDITTPNTIIKISYSLGDQLRKINAFV